jgi:hypothetical protein
LCVSQGVYLLLEKLKQPIYRRLFRRVQLIHAGLSENATKAVQVPLGGRAPSSSPCCSCRTAGCLVPQ